jgi:MarR family transcriptional regulator, 2-MHQ and catechol-resistance regulon repressor
MNKYNQYNEQDTHNLKLVIGLYRSQTNLNRQTQKMLAEHKLTMAQFSVLEALYHLGDMKINDIIEKTLSSSGNITVVIKNLEKDKLIERYPDPKDSRVCMIRLTASGEDMIRSIFPENLKLIENFMKNLSKEEKLELNKLLKKLNGLI